MELCQNIRGLNWGQREHRNRNQAYIPLRPEIYKSDYFPKRSIPFTIITDDDKTFICSRAQKNYGDSIHTPTNNALLGSYFRYRLELADGSYINLSDLYNYGRTDVEFTKIDDETYYMDFSVNK